MSEPIRVGDTEVAAGEQCSLELLCARLPTHTQLSIPVVVVNGRRPGPVLWLSAALHGDELNGVEIIREILAAIRPDNLRGAIIAVPIVNVFGYLHQSRYLPDGRDLNRSFPGSARGSLASRVAHLFMSEIVGKATHGIDLHTATHHRTNLPQVRADLDDEGSRACAIAFGAPATIHARVRDGSLREAATRRGIPVVVYEGGEALRFDQEVIRVGVRGVGQVMQSLGMTKDRGKKRQHSALTATHTTWVRAPRAGILRLEVDAGARVAHGQRLGTIGTALGDESVAVRAPCNGLVIGHTRNPVVYQGDGLVHVAKDP